MPLVIPKRQIDLGDNGSFKPKTIGEEHFARLAVAVKGAVLSAEEFNDLLLDPGAYKRFYKTPKESDPVPRFDTFSYLPLNSFDNASVNLFVARRVLKLERANIVTNRILLLPANPIWQFTIQALPGLDEKERGAVIDLLLKLGDKAQFELECETYGHQPSLPLEEDPEGTQNEDSDEDEPASGMQRQIEANETRKGRKAAQ